MRYGCARPGMGVWVLAVALGMAPSVTRTALGAPEPAPKIPLRAGLTVVTAINQEDGDYESIKQVQTIDDQLLVMRFTCDRHPDFVGDPPVPAPPPPAVIRKIRRADLKNAHTYMQ